MLAARTGARIGLAWTLLAVVGCSSTSTRPAEPSPPSIEGAGAVDPAVRALIDEHTAAVNAVRTDASRWGRLGMAFEANGLLVQALECYGAAATLDDREPRWRYRQALLRARRGDVNAALADLDRVIALAPDYAPARWRRGLWRLDQGDTAGAAAAFTAANDIAPDDPAGAVGLSLVHLSKGENGEAAARLEQILATAPGDRYAQQLLGTAYRRLGREEEARLALTIGASGQPVWRDPWSDEVSQYRRGFAAMLKEATELGLDRQFDRAIGLLEQLRRLRPDDRALQVYLGGMYASTGRLQDAVDTLNPVLASDPNNFDAVMHLASAYLFAGDLVRAAGYATRALELRPASADAAKLQGIVQWRQDRTGEATALFARAAEEDPRDPMPHLWLGMILGQQTRYLDARRHFESAVARDPMLGDALIGLADTYAATGSFDRARAVLRRAERADPTNPRLPAARDRILATRGGSR
jgi:tetratricopeptide (TPR) repeat protein